MDALSYDMEWPCVSKYLDGEVVLPVVRERLVELAVLFLRDVVRVACPDRLRLVQLLILRVHTHQHDNQSINQHENCRVPLYDTSRSANSSQW